jgi:hypothetical protein
MKDNLRKHWSRTHSAYLGAFLGMGIAMAHNVHHAFVGEIPNENPLVHIFPELIGLASAGALFFVVIAEVRNRLVGAAQFAGAPF